MDTDLRTHAQIELEKSVRNVQRIHPAYDAAKQALTAAGVKFNDNGTIEDKSFSTAQDLVKDRLTNTMAYIGLASMLTFLGSCGYGCTRSKDIEVPAIAQQKFEKEKALNEMRYLTANKTSTFSLPRTQLQVELQRQSLTLRPKEYNPNVEKTHKALEDLRSDTNELEQGINQYFGGLASERKHIEQKEKEIKDIEVSAEYKTTWKAYQDNSRTHDRNGNILLYIAIGSLCTLVATAKVGSAREYKLKEELGKTKDSYNTWREAINKELTTQENYISMQRLLKCEQNGP